MTELRPEDLIDDAAAAAASAHIEALEERLREAAVDGYDYLYVVDDYGTRDLSPSLFGGDPERPGDALTGKTRTLASNLKPEHMLWTLDMHGSARAYDLSDLTDQEREQIGDGELPERLWQNRLEPE